MMRSPVVGSRLQMNARRLVGAVLRPHHRKDAELNQRWLAAHSDLIRLNSSE